MQNVNGDQDGDIACGKNSWSIVGLRRYVWADSDVLDGCTQEWKGQECSYMSNVEAANVKRVYHEEDPDTLHMDMSIHILC